MEKLTVRQIEFLETHGLPIPPTKQTASRIIGYVMKGNGANNEPTTFFERLTFLKSLQNSWQGKVVYRNDDKYLTNPGMVKHLVPRTSQEVQDWRKCNKKYHNNNCAAAFNVVVKWQNNNTTYLCLSLISRIAEE